jgi:hypothetical protein
MSGKDTTAAFNDTLRKGEASPLGIPYNEKNKELRVRLGNLPPNYTNEGNLTIHPSIHPSILVANQIVGSKASRLRWGKIMSFITHHPFSPSVIEPHIE